MTPFTTHSGIAAPLRATNVDTDVIIRIEHLITVPKADLGAHCFEAWRMRDGRPDGDFVLNRAPWDRASILLAGANFGCGSSREAAVWALQGFGFRVVVAPSFGDIFFGNCLQNGMLPVVLPQAEVDALCDEAEARPDGAFRVDLEAGTVIPPSGRRIPFGIEASARERLLLGLDEIAMTLRHGAALDAFDRRDLIARPWIYALDTYEIQEADPPEAK